MNKLTDKQRHANKIRNFDKACERIGDQLLVDKIGKGAFSSMLCAKDAQIRSQHPAIVAGFISDADSRYCEFVDDKWSDLQIVLKSI